MGNSFYYIGTSNKHMTGIFCHEHKIGNCRRIYSAASTGTENSRYLRDNSRRQGIFKKNISISTQTDNAFLDSRSPGIIQADNRNTYFQGHIHYLANFLCKCFRKGSSKHRKVLGKYHHLSTIYSTVSGYNTIGENTIFFQAKVI